MRILITGGGGFIGQKLARKLAADGEINRRSITEIILADVVESPSWDVTTPTKSVVTDISQSDGAEIAFATQPDIVFHLAAVVSGAAEADFDLGMRVNLDGTMNVFECARRQSVATGNPPIVVYASSVAAHGGQAPQIVTDDVELNPQTSYGTQKAIGELLLQDYSRRGFLDGRGLRLPTVSIRPGKPNAAASSFMSSIFRDTMEGRNSNCPVDRNFPVWHTSPRTVVKNLIHAASIPSKEFGFNRNINLPGRTDTIGEMISAMTMVAGPEAETRITWDKDPGIKKIVMGWRAHFKPTRALSMGFTADRSFADSVRYFLDDDIT